MTKHVKFVEYRSTTEDNIPLHYFWEGENLEPPKAVRDDMAKIVAANGQSDSEEKSIHIADVLGFGTPYVYDFIHEDKNGSGHWVAYGLNVQELLKLSYDDVCGFRVWEGINIGFDKRVVKELTVS